MSASRGDHVNQRRYFNDRTNFSYNQSSSRAAASNKGSVGSCRFRLATGRSEFSPIGFLRHLADRVARAVCMVSMRRRRLDEDSSSASLGRSKTLGASADSHRTAAVEDCIEFIHSSFSRSNSVTTTSH
ncbi:putative JOSEPHIN-like protein [Quillaja saponaria]|uniref:JOSEPHIN-like protein n=1 Tax=Quillaja saponaria TaxID=32244 RepID=A0AAD7PRF6_QUISA|nr:putative JOSEPHIN-like protein [Quillaja saponaria]